jgi:UDP:flavonoid glycosyltransferase YjiC (YdhE family)
VLVVTLPEKGHYHPLVGPAVELARRGHDVVLAATCDITRELAAASGLRAIAPPGAAPPPDKLRGAALAAVLVDPAALAGWIRELLVEAPRAGVAPLRAIIRDVRPDVIAIDTMAYDAAIAAELEGVPWVGWATSLNPVVPDAMDSTLIRTLRALDPERHALFADHGLAARFRVSDVLSPRGTAVFATEAFAGPAPDGVALVGPSLGGTRGGEPVDPAFARGRPIVYVSFGSQAWHQPHRFAKLFAAADAIGVALVAAMGDLAAPRPGHACVRFAAQLDALRVARAIVSHGGANSVMEAVALGVPLLVAPICNDQPHNRWFVERAGCGLGIDLDACSHDELASALARLVADGPERARARELAADYRRSGAAGAADLAEHA